MLYLYYGGWGFMIISLIISMAASAYVKSTFSKYNSVGNSRYMTGSQVARSILDSHGLYNINIIHVAGDLTDYYNNSRQTVALSDTVYGSTSIAAAAVAAHECGHAVQYQKEYFPIKVRNFVIPFTQFGSRFWYLSVIIGLIFGNSQIGNIFLYFGIILLVVICFFQLVTLPVEFNASSRAIKILEEEHILTLDEIGKARKVLIAAALTYVAALLTSILQLLRILSIAKNRKDDR